MAARLETDLTILASDDFEGREAGTEGYDAAASYLVHEFRKIGLKPAGENGRFLQPVPLRRAYAVDRDAAMSIDGDQLILHGDYITLPAPDAVKARVTGELVFVGYGVDALRFNMRSYCDIDVEGKIVVFLRGTPPGLPSEEAAHLNKLTTKMAAAAEAGAIGAIVASPTDASTDRGRARMMREARRVDHRWIAPPEAAADIQPRAMLTRSGTEKLLAGTGIDIDALFAGQVSARPLGKMATLETRSRYEDYTSANVMAMIEGSDPSLRDEAIVLSAHLDHIGKLNAIDEDRDLINNGAMDNASGIAILLEVARRFAAADAPPRRSVVFAAVTAEERGLLGSDYLAQFPPAALPKMVANVNLDMPILLHDFTDVIAFGAAHSTLTDIVADAAAAEGVSITPDPVPEMALFVRSDHYSFVKAGVPSVFLFLGFDNGGEESFRNFMNTHYHQPSDQPDLPIRYDVGARFAALNAAIAAALANADAAPAWHEGDFFGETFGLSKP